MIVARLTGGRWRGAVGRCVGETARWQAPGGGTGAARIVSVLFQPEATGDYRS